MRTSCACGPILAFYAISSLGLVQEGLHVVALPDDIKWGPASPKLPRGAQFATLVGEPFEARRAIRIPREAPRRLQRSTTLASDG